MRRAASPPEASGRFSIRIGASARLKHGVAVLSETGGLAGCHRGWEAAQVLSFLIMNWENGKNPDGPTSRATTPIETNAAQERTGETGLRAIKRPVRRKAEPGV